MHPYKPIYYSALLLCKMKRTAQHRSTIDFSGCGRNPVVLNNLSLFSNEKRKIKKSYGNSHSIILISTYLGSRENTLLVREVNLHVFLEIKESKLIILSKTK